MLGPVTMIESYCTCSACYSLDKLCFINAFISCLMFFVPLIYIYTNYFLHLRSRCPTLQLVNYGFMLSFLLQKSPFQLHMQRYDLKEPSHLNHVLWFYKRNSPKILWTWNILKYLQNTFVFQCYFEEGYVGVCPRRQLVGLQFYIVP